MREDLTAFIDSNPDARELKRAVAIQITVIASEEVSDGIILDYNAEGKVVGIEVLYISQRSPNSWQQILLETTV